MAQVRASGLLEDAAPWGQSRAARIGEMVEVLIVAVLVAFVVLGP
jgi:hypothetical protein